MLQLQAAVGLCVGVGSFSDPWPIQGMAHFLEHMVFMGSEKYPKENDFEAFIRVSSCYVICVVTCILPNFVYSFCTSFLFSSFCK